MRFDEERRVGGRRIDRWAAALALLGAVAVVIANVVAARLNDDVGFFADTISDLAAGRYAWVLDTALILFAIGVAAIGVALWPQELDGWRWRTGSTLAILVAAAIVVIALYEEYGDGDTGGTTIHLEVVVAMALAFTLSAWLIAPGLTRVGSGWATFSSLMGLLWLLLGLAFFFLAPDDLDGLVERLAAGALVIWAVGMAWLVSRERRARSTWAGRGNAATTRRPG